MELITRFFPECMIFLMRANDGFSFQVAAQGIREMGLSRENLEDELNRGVFYNRIVPEHRRMLRRQSRDVLEGIDFSSNFAMMNPWGERVGLFMKTDYVDDVSSDVRCLIIISHRNSIDS
jgi:hypothetical protein